MHGDTRNVYSTTHAIIYNTLHEMPRILDNARGLYKLLKNND